MTTLPQTTAIRVPQRSPHTSAVLAHGPMMAAPTRDASHAMSGADVWRTIRAHIWLIIIMLIASAIGGYVLNVYLANHWSRYTATGLIQIQPQTNFSVILQGQTPTMDTATLAVDQKTQAAMLTHDSLLLQVLRRDEVRATGWFKSFGGNVVKAKEDLQDELDVRAIPDTRLVAVSMTYSKPADCATIVDQIVTQHLANQQKASVDRVIERSAC